MALFPLVLLCMLLTACVWHDVRARRIPNAIVLPGALAALALHALLPGGLGLAAAAGGWALGLALLMPMYALRLMGAGDVKLLAMVGAFFGASQIFTVFLLTLVAGGVLALVVAGWQGQLRRLLGNAWQMAIHSGMAALAGSLSVTPPTAASGRLPYAIAIAAAAAPCALWLHLTGTLPL